MLENTSMVRMYFLLVYLVPTENKAAYSDIILLFKKCVFTCIMAVYDEKDSVNTGKMKKRGWLHLIYGICVSYFWSG